MAEVALNIWRSEQDLSIPTSLLSAPRTFYLSLNFLVSILLSVMANKVRVSVRLDLDHELGFDHYQTWQSQLDIGFQLHTVTDEKQKYLAAANNLGEQASHYLWQKFPTVPAGSTPYADLIKLFDEYYGSAQSSSSRLAGLFSISQREGETIQAYRARILKEMRLCQLTSSTGVADILGIVGTHLFARGLSSMDARKSVIESDTKDLTAAATKAQAVVLAEESCQSKPPTTQVNYAQRRSTSNHHAQLCVYCGQQHVPGKPNCPAANLFCSSCGKKGHFPTVCRSGEHKSHDSSTAPIGHLELVPADSAEQWVTNPGEFETF